MKGTQRNFLVTFFMRMIFFSVQKLTYNKSSIFYVFRIQFYFHNFRTFVQFILCLFLWNWDSCAIYSQNYHHLNLYFISMVTSFASLPQILYKQQKKRDQFLKSKPRAALLRHAMTLIYYYPFNLASTYLPSWTLRVHIKIDFKMSKAALNDFRLSSCAAALKVEQRHIIDAQWNKVKTTSTHSAHLCLCRAHVNALLQRYRAHNIIVEHHFSQKTMKRILCYINLYKIIITSTSKSAHAEARVYTWVAAFYLALTLYWYVSSPVLCITRKNAKQG